MRKFALLPILPLALMGCATSEATSPTNSECDATSSQSLIGQKATKELAEQIVKNSGALKLRWLAPNTMVTMEFSPVRVNVAYDEQMIVTGITCG